LLRAAIGAARARPGRGARARGVHLAPVPRPRPQLEPDQELTLGVVIEAAPLPHAAQPPAPLEGDEGDDVLLPELHVVNAHILPRLRVLLLSEIHFLCVDEQSESLPRLDQQVADFLLSLQVFELLSMETVIV